jgi:3'(2'), 5'-bisphosphate nucleotidase
MGLVITEDINKKIIEGAVRAGKAVLKIYNSGQYEIKSKEDKSPLTIADSLSNEILIYMLGEIKLDGEKIPVISEEGKHTPYDTRKDFKRYWLIDPLDGTKEFISKNGEFTINIALVEASYPVLGVIYIPIKDTIYYGIKDVGSFKVYNNKEEKISAIKKSEKITVVQSRSHSEDSEDKFYSHFNIEKRIFAGSSLKFCLVAEGKAHLYYRAGPTMEWDTAAGQAVVENAGGFVISSAKRMTYNKKSLKNNSFIVSSFHDRRIYELIKEFENN